MVFGLDEGAELLGELRLVDTAEGGEGKAVLACSTTVFGFGFVGADGVGAADIPEKRAKSGGVVLAVNGYSHGDG